jgi:hypothetical protein
MQIKRGVIQINENGVENSPKFSAPEFVLDYLSCDIEIKRQELHYVIFSQSHLGAKFTEWNTERVTYVDGRNVTFVHPLVDSRILYLQDIGYL